MGLPLFQLQPQIWEAAAIPRRDNVASIEKNGWVLRDGRWARLFLQLGVILKGEGWAAAYFVPRRWIGAIKVQYCGRFHDTM